MGRVRGERERHLVEPAKLEGYTCMTPSTTSRLLCGTWGPSGSPDKGKHCKTHPINTPRNKYTQYIIGLSLGFCILRSGLQ